MFLKKSCFFIYLCLSLLFVNGLYGQNQGVEIIGYTVAKQGLDSLSYRIMYNLSLLEEQDFARISVQRRDIDTDFYYDISDRTQGDLGEITAGSD